MILLKWSLVMAKLNDFIHVYENALRHDVCDFIVNFFEDNHTFYEIISNEGAPNFTQINLTKNREINKLTNKVHNQLIKETFKYRDLYYDYVYKDVFPDSHAFEEFRIKKYKVGGEDRFDTHVDVMSYSSSRRFLSFFWYLNTVEEGGETEFDELIIKPKKGSLVVFPPLWMFPHKGHPPVSEPKYLLSTYLHYT